jgi:hypothetical protein
LPWVTKIFLKKVRGLQVISYFHVFDGFAVGIIHGKRPWVKIPWVYAIFLVVKIQTEQENITGLKASHQSAH